MIKSRSSDDVLTVERILSKISEADIFAYYCNSFKKLGVKFCSELRQDKQDKIAEWKQLCESNFYKSLDHRSFFFKKEQKDLLPPKK